jgi:hypothetical protein
MRIEGTPGEALQTAYLWLTRSEAAELRDALTDLLVDGERTGMRTSRRRTTRPK